MLDLPSYLTGVYWHAEDRGRAFCPSHENKRAPALAFRNTGDRWLVYCFAGCQPLEVCGALGLRLNDLFHDGRVRPSGDLTVKARATDALAALEHEATILLLIGEEMERGRIADTSPDRIAQAIARIAGARRACGL